MRPPRWIEIGLSVALLAYPRAFRHRFGAEMRRDFLERDATATRTSGTDTVGTGTSGTRTRGTLGTLGILGTLALSGLAERRSAAARFLFWPNQRPHLYSPAGSHAMFWDTLRLDLQHTLRLARKTPLVTTLTILALALGIGATSAIFAVVNSVLIQPLPYAQSDRLVNVWSDAARLGRPRNTMSPANFIDFQRMNHTLDGFEGYFSFVTPFKASIDGPSEMVIGVFVTPRLFELLGRTPVLGRSFAGDPAAFEMVVSHGFWQRRFGGQPTVIGRTMQVGNNTATIVGVMPPDFTFPYGTMLGPSGFTRSTTIDAWAPITFSGPGAAANRMLNQQGQLVRGVHWFGAIGRMKPGLSVAEVQADLSTVARQLEQTYPDTNAGWGATVVPVLEQTVGTVRTPLLVLLSGVGFVLLIATVNVANLMLARSVARRREFATRIALGAGRGRMIRQALTEGLVLGLVGGMAGLILARWGVSALVALAPADLPRLQDINPDERMLLATIGVSAVIGILIGLLPALMASQTAPQSALQEHSRGAIGGAFRHRARAALVVAEVALAVTLTIGAGLLFRSFTALMAVNPGFAPDHMLTWQMNIPERLETQEERSAFYREFLARMKALPGVISAGGTSRLPLGSTGLTTTVDIEARPRPNAEWPEVQFRRALGDYFQTMGIPILRGRTFNDGDGPTAPPVYVVNQTLAAKLFPGEDPVGKHIRLAANQPWATIIGVVGDIKHAALDETPQPEMYANHLQGPLVSPYVVMRTTTDAAQMVDLVRAEARAIDRDLPVFRIQTIEAVRSESVAQQRFILLLVAIFGVLALSLAAIGVYGVMSLLVSERTQEVGVRLALGANPSHVLRMLVGHAVRLALAGVVVGLALSLAVMPLLGSQLYAVQPRDPVTHITVPIALMIVALLAALVPARRAMRVDPVSALRYE